MSLPNPFNKKDDEPVEEQAVKPAGMTRKSAASAKPAREAAQGVRVVSSSGASKSSSSPATKTKEQRKAERKAEREAEDEFANLTEIYLKKDERYKKLRRYWWIMIGIGFVMVVVSFLIVYILGGNRSQSYDTSTPAGVVSLVLLAISYIIIIAAIIWEFVKVRPIRNEAADKVKGMSNKRRNAMLEEAYKEQEAKRAAKAAKKAARKK